MADRKLDELAKAIIEVMTAFGMSAREAERAFQQLALVSPSLSPQEAPEPPEVEEEGNPMAWGEIGPQSASEGFWGADSPLGEGRFILGVPAEGDLEEEEGSRAVEGPATVHPLRWLIRIDRVEIEDFQDLIVLYGEVEKEETGQGFCPPGTLLPDASYRLGLTGVGGKVRDQEISGIEILLHRVVLEFPTASLIRGPHIFSPESLDWMKGNKPALILNKEGVVK